MMKTLEHGEGFIRLNSSDTSVGESESPYRIILLCLRAPPKCIILALIMIVWK